MHTTCHKCADWVVDWGWPQPWLRHARSPSPTVFIVIHLRIPDLLDWRWYGSRRAPIVRMQCCQYAAKASLELFFKSRATRAWRRCSCQISLMPTPRRPFHGLGLAKATVKLSRVTPSRPSHLRNRSGALDDSGRLIKTAFLCSGRSSFERDVDDVPILRDSDDPSRHGMITGLSVAHSIRHLCALL